MYRDATLSSDQFEGLKNLGCVPIENLANEKVYQVSWENTDLIDCWENGRDQPNIVIDTTFFTAMYILKKVDFDSVYFYHPTMEHEYLVLDKNTYFSEWYCKTIS